MLISIPIQAFSLDFPCYIQIKMTKKGQKCLSVKLGHWRFGFPHELCQNCIIQYSYWIFCQCTWNFFKIKLTKKSLDPTNIAQFSYFCTGMILPHNIFNSRRLPQLWHHLFGNEGEIKGCLPIHNKTSKNSN